MMSSLVSVTHHAGFRGGDEIEVELKKIEKNWKTMDVQIYAGSHALSGVGRGISNKFSGVTPVEVDSSDTASFFSGS